jgi:hypothetical protein
VILINYFTVRDGRIVMLIITATEPTSTPSGGKPECSGPVQQTE